VAGQNELKELGVGLRRKFVMKEGLFDEVTHLTLSRLGFDVVSYIFFKV